MVIFKKIKNKLKNANYMHYICFSIILLSLNLAVFVYSLSWERFFQNIIDFWESLKYYFSAIYLSEDIPINISSVKNIDLTKIVTYDIDTLIRKFDFFGMYFWDGDNFRNYCFVVSEGTFMFLAVGSLVIPIMILLIKIIKNTCPFLHPR